MFNGYMEETFTFFMALRFNNNTEFFHANHDWYTRCVREPSLALAALGDVVEAIDPDLERRPNRVVSRINRDIRFSKDKTPYRDYLWLSFREPDKENSRVASFYVDLSDSGLCNCGMGLYNENRPLMQALRADLLRDAAPLTAALAPLAGTDIALHTNPYRRLTIPDSVPDALRPLYNAKGFYYERHIGDRACIMSPALADTVREAFTRLAPLYHYLKALPLSAEE